LNTRDTAIRTRRIAGFGMNSPDAARLTTFFETALGARHVSTEHLSGTRVERGMGVRSGALRHRLELGNQSIDILQFDMPGSPYPRLISPDDAVFQHFAIVVSDMGLGLAQLMRTPGWTAISTAGPQRLPQRSGGVTAFKFQDPDGHPLELLEFPAHAVPQHWKQRSRDGLFLGIDHSAISVRDTTVSTAFYESLGFRVTAKTFNHGIEQAQLDGIASPQVEVSALAAAHESTPHLELLCYRSDPDRPRHVLASNAVAATRIELAVDGLESHADKDAATRLIVDPDGHHLILVP
jgi:catechol 2,3-dioxygenase-like lactoylglutathione lyase family enzyme